MSEAIREMTPGAEFEQATNEYLAELYAGEPVMATEMGVHDYDDLLPDYSRLALTDRLQQARAYLHRIDRLSLVRMTADERLDYRLARADTQLTISRLESIRPLERMPGIYVETALKGVFLLLARDFADSETRAACALARLRALPLLLLQARDNLQIPPRLCTERALMLAHDGQAFLSQALPVFAAQVSNETLRGELLEAAGDAAESLADYARYLSAELLPRSTGDCALGRELFEYHLRVGHGVEETCDDLLAMGRETLETARTALSEAAARIDSDRAWTELIALLQQDRFTPVQAREALEQEVARARAFISKSQMADIPDGEALVFRSLPACAWLMPAPVAYLPPAPFEEHLPGQLWLIGTDLSPASDSKAGAWLPPPRIEIPLLAVHLTYPGHHLQRIYANRVPSRFRRHFGGSGLFIEGWACYCEEIMLEAGFFNDPGAQLMQRNAALRRACQALVDVGLHSRQMTPEEAAALLMQEGGIEEAEAHLEVQRLALSPTQATTSLLGVRQLQSLRHSLERRQGARFDSRRFHTELLSYGSVPPRMIREALFSV